jgi:hypothetical protein
MMRTCPDCKTPVEDRAIFCDNCGYPLASSAAPEGQAAASVGGAAPGTCSACGFVNIPGEMFCQQCGMQLGPVTVSPPPPPVASGNVPPGGEPPGIPIPPAGAAAIDAPHPPAGGKCSACGADNPVGETFCMNCGFQLGSPGMPGVFVPEAAPPPIAPPAAPPAPAGPPSPAQGAAASSLRCPGCGVLNDITDLFCQDCGSSLQQPKGGFSPGKLLIQTSNTVIELPAGKTEITLGRMDPPRNIYPDIDLSPHGGDIGGVSRLHARILVLGSQVVLEDLNSTNFTFLNKQKIQPGQHYPLKNGDEIRMGRISVVYYRG